MDNFYFDLDLHQQMLRRVVIDIVGTNRLLYGTNFVGEYGDGDLTKDAGLAKVATDNIRYKNAMQLFKL